MSAHDGDRSALDAARGRRDALRQELSRLEVELASLAPLADRRRALEAELAAARDALARSGGDRKRALPLLSSVRVASPCEASWEAMRGDHRVRHCDLCDQKVYDLSAMRAEDAEALLRANGESICVRYHERADGTVMSADCPVGAKRRRRRAWALSSAAAVAMAAAGLGATMTIGTEGPAFEPPLATAKTPLATSTFAPLVPLERMPPRALPNPSGELAGDGGDAERADDDAGGSDDTGDTAARPPLRPRMGRVAYHRR